MCETDLDTILSYLSSKVNRIFCDREFVGCVKEDFDVLLENSNNKCCVLFPKLKPIFLKVLRYQAAIFNLSVFCVGTGPNQVAVVCRKEFLKSQTNERTCEEEQTPKTMNETKTSSKSPAKRSNKASRPTQSYYVPPAQRSVTQKDIPLESTKTSKKTLNQTINKTKEMKTLPLQITTAKNTNDTQNNATEIIIPKEKTEEPIELRKNLVEIESLDCPSSSKSLPIENYELPTNVSEESIESTISVDNPDTIIASINDNGSSNLSESPSCPVTEDDTIQENHDSSKLNIGELCGQNLDLENLRAVIESQSQLVSTEVIQSDVLGGVSNYGYLCPEVIQKYEKMLPLENEDELRKVLRVLKSILIEKPNVENLKHGTENNMDHKEDVSGITSQNIDTVQTINESLDKIVNSDPQNNCIKNKSPVYISYSDDDSTVKKKTVDCDIDNENEEMRRVIINMNRKTRPIIKHIRNDNTLRIDTTEEMNKKSKNKIIEEDQDNNLSSWEDMFDENGDLQPEYVEEIVERIGCDVKVVQASHDYSAYQNAKYSDLEHVIELYDFPSTFKTQDLMQLYKGASQDPMYVKWCDDTHALLVLSSPAQAQRALQIEHEIIKSRPLTQASSVAAVTASSSDLKPAMKRPQTNMQTARRLINTHLGTKAKLTKEEVEQERQALRDAREQRRQERQNEKDAWEGRPYNAKTTN